ncbi:MAG: acetylornithine deacetylase, partial [Bacteroidota bacterium]
MKSFVSIFLLLTGFCITDTSAQQLSQAEMEALSAEYAIKSFPMLKALYSIPNDAHFPEDIEKNIQWCEEHFAQRDFTTQRIKTETVPLLLAERKHEGAEKTVLIYLQLDGQPVAPSRWAQESPWKPALKQPTSEGGFEEIPWERISQYEDEWRIFVRAAADAKGPVGMFLASLDVIKDKGLSPNYNI